MWSLKYADKFSSLSHDIYHTYHTYHTAFLQDFFHILGTEKTEKKTEKKLVWKKKELCLKFLTHKEYKIQKQSLIVIEHN